MTDTNLAEFNKKINFIKLLSNDTTYGVIWEGKYNNTESCIIKMIKLSSGTYKDSKIFDTNNEIPYLHKEFRDKKALKRENFFNEVNNIQLLSNLGISPTYYDYFISDKKYSVHYGFIVMKKMDCSLKDIFKKRGIDVREDNIIKAVINRMHNENKIIHGDMKPSNICVNLDEKGRIKECRLVDCNKLKTKGTLNDKKFTELIKKDWDVYEKHKKRNRGHK